MYSSDVLLTLDARFMLSLHFMNPVRTVVIMSCRGSHLPSYVIPLASSCLACFSSLYFGMSHTALVLGNRSVAEDLEAVNKRLRSTEEAHSKEVDEHQRRSNDLQERLVETRAEKAEVSVA